MYPAFRSARAVFVACLLSFTLAAVVSAEEKPSGKAPDTKALDAYLYTSLRSVINLGVEQYNAGNIDRCVEHFRQSLEQLGPVLSHHPELQAKIKAEIDKIDKDPEYRAKLAAKAQMPNPQLAPANRQMAFALRSVLNDVRSGLGGTTEEPKAVTLWDRLGGEKGVRKVVDDFVAAVAADPKVDITRGGKYKLDALKVEDLKKKLVEMISEATGGPLKYTGKDMKTIHKGMGITDAEFDAAGGHLKAALEKNGVKPADTDAVMKVVGSTRKDIVEGKKPSAEGVLQGKVLFDDKPLAGAKVSYVGRKGKTFSATTDDKGAFKLNDGQAIPFDQYDISVTSDNALVPKKYGDSKTSGMSGIVNGPNVNHFWPLLKEKPEEKKPTEGKVQGRVTFDDKPLAGAKVTLVGRMGKTFTATADATGAYKLNDGNPIPLDKYDISVTSDNPLVPKKYGDIKTSGMNLALNHASFDLPITLLSAKPEPKPDEDGSVQGTVSLDGKPLAKGTVNFIKVGHTIAAAITDGKYKMPKAAPGSYTVTVINNADVPVKYGKSTTSPLTVEVQPGANNLDVKLEGEKKPEEKKPTGGSVKGKVTLDGKPITKGGVFLWCPQTGNTLEGSITANGTYEINGTAEKPLESREHHLMISGPGIPERYGKEEWSAPFTVKDGANTLDLSLKTDRKLPEGLQLPGPHVTVMELRASGEQFYESQASAGGGFEWVLQGPNAQLTDELTGEPQGKHYGSPVGPVWEIKGFAVTGEVLSKVDAKAGNIPWLLLRVKHIEPKRPGGYTPGLSSIQRIDTEGGVAPTKAPEKAGELVKVPYKATYLVSIGAKTAAARKERKIPDAIAAPAGHKPSGPGELDIEGVHVYESKAKAGGGLEWSLKEAVGTLIEKTESIGKVSVGSSGLILEIKDLKVTADIVKKAEASEGRIPWSLLQVKKMTIKGEDFKDGSPVSYIQFVDAEGSLTPAKPPEKAGQIALVPFQASLVFYEGKAEEKKPEDKPKGEEGKLFGLVRSDGKILIGGKVVLVGEDGKTYEGPLDDKGDYKINEGKPFPVGTYKVAIISDDPLAPKKYADPKTSGSTVKVTKEGIPMSWNLQSDKPKPEDVKPTEGKLLGVVYLAWKPVTSGKVVLTSDDGKTHEGALDAKGVYKIDDGKAIPVGTYKVAVVSDEPLLKKKYADPKTSGLTVAVTNQNTPSSWNLKSTKPEEGKLFGLVRFDNKILSPGKIVLVDEDGKTYEGKLEANGNYSINDGKPIPADDYKVAIISDDPLLPKKYADAKTSGLTVRVTKEGIPMSWNLRSDTPPVKKPEEKKPEESKREGMLSGLVLLDGKPLAGGKLLVVGSDGKSVDGVLDNKGNFTTNEGKPLPLGTYKVAILSDNPLVPKKYADVKTSGLAVSVNTRGFPTSLHLSSKETGGVFGYLLVDKKFLSGGKVVLLGDDGKTYTGILNDKGVFKINDGKPIPPGTYKAKIETEDPLLAKKYADEKTSGLTVMVSMTDLNLLWHLDGEKP